LILLSLALFLTGCLEEETDTAACDNIKCPMNFTLTLYASSETTCEAALNSSIEDENVAAGCFLKGTCSYSCTAASACCKGEKWHFNPEGEVIGYSCEQSAASLDKCPGGGSTGGTTGEGATGEGSTGGTTGEGATGEGSPGEGTTGEGTTGEGTTGEGTTDEGATGEGEAT
jgi:hypothetical protein